MDSHAQAPVPSPRHPRSSVRAQRRRLGLQQAVLADLAGVGVAFVYDLEHGKPTVRLDKVLAVLGVLGLGLVVEESGVPLRARPAEAPGAEPDPGPPAPGGAP